MVLTKIGKFLVELGDDLVLVALVQRRDQLTRLLKLSLNSLEFLSDRSSIGLCLGKILLRSLEFQRLVSELLLESLDLALKKCLMLSLEFVNRRLVSITELLNGGLRLSTKLLQILAMDLASLVLPHAFSRFVTKLHGPYTYLSLLERLLQQLFVLSLDGVNLGVVLGLLTLNITMSDDLETLIDTHTSSSAVILAMSSANLASTS